MLLILKSANRATSRKRANRASNQKFQLCQLKKLPINSFWFLQAKNSSVAWLEPPCETTADLTYPFKEKFKSSASQKSPHPLSARTYHPASNLRSQKALARRKSLNSQGNAAKTSKDWRYNPPPTAPSTTTNRQILSFSHILDIRFMDINLNFST